MKFSKQKLLTSKKNNRGLKTKKLHYKTIKGTAERPRFSIYKSNRYLYVQIINDSEGQTLLSCATRQREIKSLSETASTCNCIAGKILGQEVAKLSLEKNIKKVVFDRGSYLYHGKIQAIAEGARAAGLEF